MTLPRRPVYIDEILKFGLDTGFAAHLSEILRNGVDLVSQDPQGIRAVAEFLQAARSETEHRWSLAAPGAIASRFGKTVIFTGYEWESFKIPGGSYTPDFLYILDNGHHVFVEVKGSKEQKNYRDARTKLRAAATLNPWHTFFEARPDGKRGLKLNAWVLEQIHPDPAFIQALIQI